MSTPDVSKLVNVPANVASLVAVHAQATSAVAVYAAHHARARYEYRKKLHAENLMKQDVENGVNK